MDKGVGFNRNIKLEWLDATAAFCAETDDPAEIRKRLQAIVGLDLNSPTNIRKTIDILLNIWFKSAVKVPDLHAEALRCFQETSTPTDRLWLHYGLILLTYPFFQSAVNIIGQISRYEETLTTTTVRQRLFAELGELGSVKEATNRITFSLRDWGILTESNQRFFYKPRCQALIASGHELEAWLLACALHAHPAQEIPFADLLHLPILFPFRFTLTAHDLRQLPGFEVQRQGLGFDMVRSV